MISELDCDRTNTGYEEYLFQPLYIWKRQWNSLAIPQNLKELGTTVAKIVFLFAAIPLVLWSSIAGRIYQNIRIWSGVWSGWVAKGVPYPAMRDMSRNC